MNVKYCADESSFKQEVVIGNAPDIRLYFFIEASLPWEPNEFDSKSVPENLRVLISRLIAEDVNEESDTLFFLIHGEYSSKESTKAIAYLQKTRPADGYLKQEIEFSNIEEVAPFIESYLQGKVQLDGLRESETKDIFVCTHGSQDVCCARYGKPFYKEALATVAELNIPDVRIWQVSHIGGHRFAPTAIFFPDGRYYGRLDRESFVSIVTKTGDIKCLDKVYRGWAMLPSSVQFLEKELIDRYGWEWFDYKVDFDTSDRYVESGSADVEICFEKPNGDRYKYQARVLEDPNKTISIMGSCNSGKTFNLPSYTIQNIEQIASS